MDPASPPCALGIDVSQRRLHLVGLDADHRIVLAKSCASDDRFWLASLPPGATAGIDGPDGPSLAPFRDDLSVAPKFRSARGCEVELGRRHRLWVSFATPVCESELPGWMRTATALFSDLRAAGHHPFETWPYAIWVLLHGRRPPKKTTAEGRELRRDLLTQAGIRDPARLLDHAGHDALDAAAAALVAGERRTGQAVAVRCEADGTCLWLPSVARERVDAAGRPPRSRPRAPGRAPKAH